MMEGMPPGDANSDSDHAEDETGKTYDFEYLLKMHIFSFSKEKKDELIKQMDNKKKEYEKLESNLQKKPLERRLDHLFGKIDKS